MRKPSYTNRPTQTVLHKPSCANRPTQTILRKPSCIIQNDGREVPSSLLSDGYRRLFSIVIDIAFRCALLNGSIYRGQSIERTNGTVIIDEIDLHLHPTLQQVVLTALSNTFPGLQFIVSTHAPMVMSGVKETPNNPVKYMNYDAEEKTYRISK